MKTLVVRTLVALSGLGLIGGTVSTSAATHRLPNEVAKTGFHLRSAASAALPTGLSPAQIKAAYNLPANGGSGTIAIVDAYRSTTIANDLTTFSKKYSLPACTTANGCFEAHQMRAAVFSDSGWALETALDVEWAHAIAPTAKILLVEAHSSTLTDLLAAVDYARGRSDVVAVSMSWAAGEFSNESEFDSHFVSPSGAAFFAASGDGGHGVNWPAVAAPVIGVGGTTLSFNKLGQVASETAWNGSGGGLSLYEPEPAYQTSYGVPHDATAKRAVPDVAYNADPVSGVSVYDSTRYSGQSGWFQIGGTSAGAPQWAAIHALGHSATQAKLYHTAANHLRDIVSGTNGACATYCATTNGYDYVTGLGSPLTTAF